MPAGILLLAACQAGLTVVHADGQALCVAHPSTVREKDVWGLLPFLQHPQGERVLVVAMEAERHLRTAGHVTAVSKAVLPTSTPASRLRTLLPATAVAERDLHQQQQSSSAAA
jgi:hypothetical protein